MTDRINHNLFSPSFIICHISLAFATGIALAGAGLSVPPPFLLVAALLGGLLGLCGAPLRLTQTNSHALAIIFFLILGLYHGSGALKPPQSSHHVANLVNQQQEVTLLGYLEQAAEHGQAKTTLTLDTRQILIPRQATAPDTSIAPGKRQLQPATGRVQLRMRGRPNQLLLPGDLLLIRAKIGPPQGFGNPGSFNLSRFLASKKIFMSGWISSAQAISSLPSSSSLYDRLPYLPERLRARLITFLDTHLPRPHAALYRALITGDRSGLAPSLVERFRSLGIVHLLAISGLHMALLAGAVMATTYWLTQRSETILRSGSARKIAAGAAIIPLVLYCLVAGFQTPALRALLMTLVFISALLCDRQWHGPTNLSLAALAILIYNPLALTTVSFQLSFAAVLAIIIVVPQTKNFFISHNHKKGLQRRITGYLAGSLIISLTAGLATLPLLLFFFNRLTLSGPLATLIIEPFLCIWALGWGLAASVLTPLSGQLAAQLFTIGGLGLEATIWLTGKMTNLAHSFWLPTPAGWQVALSYLGLLGVLLGRSMRQRILFGLCFLAIFLPLPTRQDAVQARILDVGQGNCTVITTPANKVVVVDAGGPHTPSFDIGRHVIAPVLWRRGIRHIDLLILSHPDQDHYSGAAFLLKHFRPETLWVPTTEAADPGWQQMLALARRHDTRVQIPAAGESYHLAATTTITCLSDLHRRPQPNQNDQSLVVSLRSQGHRLLMPGDIETGGEEQLLKQESTLASAMLIAPHHGSNSSSGAGFIRAVTPQSVIFSAGRYKAKRFPAPQTMRRYRDNGADLLATPSAGAITITFSGDGPSISTFRQRQASPPASSRSQGR